MGFLLLGTVVWIVSVFGSQLGSRGLTWLLAFLLVLAFFAWVHGRFLSLSSGRGRVVTVWLITLVCVGWAYQGFLHDLLFGESEIGYGGPEGASLRAKVEVTEGGTRWEPFTVEYLEEKVQAGHTVFIDFTADWCWTCKVNEKTVLADDEVERAFRDLGVVTLKGDWTTKDPEITEILEKHQRAGVPFYAVYPAGRLDEVIVLPEIIKKGIVLDALERAGRSTAAPEA
jgi:thiol:disulfide interchange protein DsbD